MLCGGLTCTYYIVVFNFRILLCGLRNVYMAQAELEYSEYSFFVFKILYLFTFRERRWEGEREGEKHQCAWIGCLLLTPN